MVPFAARSLTEQLALVMHISAGAVGLVTGYVALSAAKGASLHRRTGMLFVYAMLTMSLLGATIAAVWGRFAFINIPAGLLTAYLVMTALATVQPDDGSLLSALGSRRGAFALMMLPLGLGLTFLVFGIQAVTSPSGHVFGFPPAPFFVFATIALISTVGDVQMILAGGAQAIRGAPRIARHLWRMSYALLIASFSFFLGQAKVIPKPIRILPLLLIPPLVVLVAMLYWLWRVRFRKSLRGLVLGSAAGSAGAAEVRRPHPVITMRAS